LFSVPWIKSFNIFYLMGITFETLGNDVGSIDMADIISTAVVSGKSL